jgi:hypothetical protein
MPFSNQKPARGRAAAPLIPRQRLPAVLGDHLRLGDTLIGHHAVIVGVALAGDHGGTER